VPVKLLPHKFNEALNSSTKEQELRMSISVGVVDMASKNQHLQKLVIKPTFEGIVPVKLLQQRFKNALNRDKTQGMRLLVHAAACSSDGIQEAAYSSSSMRQAPKRLCQSSYC
jgi:hypothetical protein